MLQPIRPRRRLVSCLLICVCAVASGAQNLNIVGAQLEMYGAPGGATDPYSGPMGISLFYGRRDVVAGMSIGGQVGYAAYYPRETGFEVSHMITWRAEVGYPFSIDVDRTSKIVMTPFIGTGFYHRWLRYEADQYQASRPMLVGGITADIVNRKSYVVGIGVQISLFMDALIRSTVGVYERAGVQF